MLRQPEDFDENTSHASIEDDPKTLEQPPASTPGDDDVSPIRNSISHSKHEILIDKSIEKEISEASVEIKGFLI